MTNFKLSSTHVEELTKFINERHPNHKKINIKIIVSEKGKAYLKVYTVDPEDVIDSTLYLHDI